MLLARHLPLAPLTTGRQGQLNSKRNFPPWKWFWMAGGRIRRRPPHITINRHKTHHCRHCATVIYPRPRSCRPPAPRNDYSPITRHAVPCTPLTFALRPPSHCIMPLVLADNQNPVRSSAIAPLVPSSRHPNPLRGQAAVRRAHTMSSPCMCARGTRRPASPSGGKCPGAWESLGLRKRGARRAVMWGRLGPRGGRSRRAGSRARGVQLFLFLLYC